MLMYEKSLLAYPLSSIHTLFKGICVKNLITNKEREKIHWRVNIGCIRMLSSENVFFFLYPKFLQSVYTKCIAFCFLI